MNDIQADVAAHQPLVGDEEPVSVLVREYEDNAAFLPKILDLTSKFRALRRCRGDGNCFYRAIVVSLGLALVRASVRPPGAGGAAPAPAQVLYEALLDRVRGASAALQPFGHDQNTTEDFLATLYEYLTGLSAGAGDAGARAESQAVAPLRGDSADYIVYALRLLTTLELESHADAYIPFILGTSDCLTTSEFCATFVMLSAVEADQVQAQALSRFLGVRTRIAYLDANAAVDEVEIIEMAGDGPAPAITLDLLFRPGHYDVVCA